MADQRRDLGVGQRRRAPEVAGLLEPEPLVEGGRRRAGPVGGAPLEGPSGGPEGGGGIGDRDAVAQVALAQSADVAEAVAAMVERREPVFRGVSGRSVPCSPIVQVQRWTVGAARVTRVVEAETPGIPPELFFPDFVAADTREIPWLVPDFAAEDGTIGFAVQAFVVEVGGRTVVVDPCVGNGKRLELPFWNDQDWPFWEHFEGAGFVAAEVDLVVHTHLHADHIGWDTRREEDAWVPTFANARHLYTEADLAFRRESDIPGVEDAYEESIAPIFAAGLADVVATDADLGDGLRLEATAGHTPGHVSLWIESEGEVGLITGDWLHHPLQCATPDTAEIGDADIEEARATRHRMLATAATTGALFVGTHFPTAPAGRVVSDGPVYRFNPVGSG